MRAFLVAIVTAGLVACGSGDRTVFADLTLRSATHRAVDAWNAKLRSACPDVSLGVVTDRGSADIEVHEDPTVPEGWTAPDGHRIEIDPSVRANEPEVLAMLIAHELGHAMGADHTNDPEDLMYGGTLDRGGSPVPTPADAHQVCRHFGAGAP